MVRDDREVVIWTTPSAKWELARVVTPAFDVRGGSNESELQANTIVF